MDPPAAQEEKEEERRAAAILELFSSPRSGPQSDDVLKLRVLLFKSPECANELPDLDEHARKALQLLTDLRLGKSGNTLIHVAARNGRADLLPPLRSALAAAASTSGRSAPADAKKSMPLADVPNANGDTPLMFGAMGGFADVVACLLAYGVSSTSANRAGMTALMCACCAGADQGDVCHLILKGLNDASHVNAQDINGNTALHFAAKAGHARCVSALLSRGAEITKRNRMNKTPLQVAQDAGIVARECVAALQRKWEELEAAAANTEKGLVKERKGAKRRLRQKQKKEGTKPQKKEQPSETESGTVAHEAGPSSEEKKPPHKDAGPSPSVDVTKAREVIQGENERQNKRVGGATPTAEAEQQQQQQQRSKDAAPQPTPAEKPEVTRRRQTTGQAPEQKGPSVTMSPDTARSSAVADQQQQQNREQSDQQRSATTAVPNVNVNVNRKAPFRYADAVAAAGKRPPPPGMPAPSASRAGPLPPKPGSSPATAAAAKAPSAQKRAENTASRPGTAAAASKELAQLRRMYEREKREKQELAASLEIMRKEKALLEVEKQLLARERDKAVERERAMDRQMRERHPQAESLALTHAHLLGSEYEDLSMEQISALQQIHSHALADLRTAMERLMVRQEQVLLEERNALQRELASLRTTAKTAKKNS